MNDCVSDKRECTITELLDELDGSGLIITDCDDIENALIEMGFANSSVVINKENR